MHASEIGLRRLASQQITSPRLDDPAEVVRRLGAVQAQDYLGALWAVGLRTVGATEETVTQALAAGRIVRTWPMRGTIHLVAPEDVRWMLALLTPRVIQGGQGRLRQLGLDAETLAASARVVAAALEGGRHLTRQGLFDQLEAVGIATAGQRGYHILVQLAQTGLICFGAHAGKQPTFALLDEWVPPAPPLPREEALAALALRYVQSRGPATIPDFCWWSGLTVADAKAGLGAIAGQVETAQYDGQTFYFDPAAAGDDPHQLYLLPPFDEFLLAYRDRSAVIAPANMGRVAPGANGMFNPIVVLGGRVAGTWHRERKTNHIALSVSPFEPWVEPHSPLVAAVDRYSRFMSADCRLQIADAA